MTPHRTPSAASLTCPDCKLGLAAVTSGPVIAHRCARCRGVWLDPASFRRLCGDEAPPPDDEAAVAPFRGPIPPRITAGSGERVRYRRCPACDEVMNRTSFGRVSGVVLDVCRPHGAWFDRGELGAIRRFLASGGRGSHERRRPLDGERPSRGAPPPSSGGSVEDVYDVLVGGDTSWDVPSRIPRLLVAAFFAALAGWLFWRAFHPHGHERGSFDAGAVALGVMSLYFAGRALSEWAARRRHRRERGEAP